MPFGLQCRLTFGLKRRLLFSLLGGGDLRLTLRFGRRGPELLPRCGTVGLQRGLALGLLGGRDLRLTFHFSGLVPERLPGRSALFGGPFHRALLGGRLLRGGALYGGELRRPVRFLLRLVRRGLEVALGLGALLGESRLTLRLLGRRLRRRGPLGGCLLIFEAHPWHGGLPDPRYLDRRLLRRRLGWFRCLLSWLLCLHRRLPSLYWLRLLRWLLCLHRRLRLLYWLRCLHRWLDGLHGNLLLLGLNRRAQLFIEGTQVGTGLVLSLGSALLLREGFLYRRDPLRPPVFEFLFPISELVPGIQHALDPVPLLAQKPNPYVEAGSEVGEIIGPDEHVNERHVPALVYLGCLVLQALPRFGEFLLRHAEVLGGFLYLYIEPVHLRNGLAERRGCSTLLYSHLHQTVLGLGDLRLR